MPAPNRTRWPRHSTCCLNGATDQAAESTTIRARAAVKQERELEAGNRATRSSRRRRAARAARRPRRAPGAEQEQATARARAGSPAARAARPAAAGASAASTSAGGARGSSRRHLAGDVFEHGRRDSTRRPACPNILPITKSSASTLATREKPPSLSSPRPREQHRFATTSASPSKVGSAEPAAQNP